MSHSKLCLTDIQDPRKQQWENLPNNSKKPWTEHIFWWWAGQKGAGHKWYKGIVISISPLSICYIAECLFGCVFSVLSFIDGNVRLCENVRIKSQKFLTETIQWCGDCGYFCYSRTRWRHPGKNILTPFRGGWKQVTMSDKLKLRIKMSALVSRFHGQVLHKNLEAPCYSMGENLYALMSVTKWHNTPSLRSLSGSPHWLKAHLQMLIASTSWFWQALINDLWGNKVLLCLLTHLLN